MILEEVAEIRRLRKRHNLTQSQLAKLAAVSQSLIAKAESGSIDPAYSKMKRIFEVLHGLEKESEPKASALMTAKIVSVTKGQSAAEAAKIMRKRGISQLPVIGRSVIIGLISEADIVGLVSQGKSAERAKAHEIMQQAPPTVPKNTPLSSLAELLSHSPLIVVVENGKPVGVITKSDIIKKAV